VSADRPTDGPLVVSIAASLAIGLLKLAAALFTGSQAVFASAADSIGDVIVSAINLVLARQASAPADADHPFGHGKIESLAGLGQGVFLAGVVAGVAYRAIASLTAAAPEPILPIPALAVMVVSLLTSTAIAWNLDRAAAATGSLVLRADATHYRMDRWTGAASILGIGLAWGFGWTRADAIASLVVAGIMAHDVVGLVRGAIDELMDHALPDDEVARVHAALDGLRPRIAGWHALRTRRSGPQRFVEVHVEIAAEVPFAEAHAITEDVEEALRAALPGAGVIVHADPVREAKRAATR
jgi:ferrous-iron efflux pump FieF